MRTLTEYHPNRADYTRCLSRSTSMGRTSVLPTFGAPRETISERTRRYDVDDRTSRDLEAQADAILRADGFDVERVDVIDVWTRLPEVSPDAVAYRGAIRFRPTRFTRQNGPSRTPRRPFGPTDGP